MSTAVAENSAAVATRIAIEPLLKIRPPSGWAALNLIEVWRFRDLMMALSARDVKLRYKQTALGVIWVVLQPLMAAAVFSFVFGRLAQMPTDGIPGFIYTYVGLLGWNVFNGTLTKTSGCLVGNSQLISKIFFPRLVLPFSSVPSVLIDFGVSVAMLVILMPIYHVHPPLTVLLMPVGLLMLLMLSIGLGLIAAALTVSYRDVQYILPVLTNILMFGSPIAYPLSDALKRIPANLQWVYLLNPLVAPLQAFKAALLGTDWPSFPSMLYATIISTGMMVIGAYSFKKMERKFADVI